MRDKSYVNMNVNPCKMCMPMGGSMAFKGIKKSMIIIHGSQGCSTYIRRHMATHYHEPVDIASSSLSEEGTVYGGSKNLKIGIKNLVSMYQPEVVGVLTSCLAETIGDDIERIVKEVRQSGDYDDIDIIPCPTPGYGGSEAEGYFSTLRSVVKYYYNKKENKKEDKKEHINIIVSNATCEDIREIKRIVSLFEIEAIYIPDISDVFDAPYRDNYNKLLDDGTDREDLYRIFDGKATIELGDMVAEHLSPAKYMEEEANVPAYRMPLPIGVNGTDRFIKVLAKISGKEIPEELKLERGRLLDGMIDSHKHGAFGRVAVYGDMDLVFGISNLLVENGVKIKLASTGTENQYFKDRLKALLEENNQKSIVLQDVDFDTIRIKIRENDINLMIGNSDGKFIKEKDGIDLIRVGFPVHDHIGAHRKLRFGYKGSIRLLDEIINHILDLKHGNYKADMYEQYYEKKGVI